MGRQLGWMVTRTGRPAMRSPGRRPARRDLERAFWVKVAEGLSSEDAAVACGVSGSVGSRWFRERGGMPSIQLGALSGRYLSFGEREEIALWRAQGLGVREIARRLGRSASTVSRELRRNAATRGGELEYRAGVAQWKAELMARRPKTAKLAANDRLREYVQGRLAAQIAGPDGELVAGPHVRFAGRRHGRRADRRWATSWSPQQISNRLRVDFGRKGGGGSVGGGVGGAAVIAVFAAALNHNDLMSSDRHCCHSHAVAGLSDRSQAHGRVGFVDATNLGLIEPSELPAAPWRHGTISCRPLALSGVEPWNPNRSMGKP